MHDPMVVVFDVPAPVPVRCSWRDDRGPRWGFDVWRRTNPENLGQLVYPWWRAKNYTLKLGGRAFVLAKFATVWHNEPDERDSGTVCKGRRNLPWAVRHWRHLTISVLPYLRVRRWRHDRCAECGHRFRWKRDARHSLSWGGTEVLHSPCASLRIVQGQRTDLVKHIAGVATETESWRALRHVDHFLGIADLDESGVVR